MLSSPLDSSLRPITVVVALGLLMAGCTTQDEESLSQTSPEAVGGTIRGSNVELASAEFDGDLAIFEEEGWGFSPSLLIFLFLEEGEIPEGREFVVEPSGELAIHNPHVHYRWWNSETEELDCDVAVDEYQMRLAFGEVNKGVLPGTIEFSVPSESTRLRGTFQAKMKS
jgi:hypothetical protein